MSIAAISSTSLKRRSLSAFVLLSATLLIVGAVNAELRAIARFVLRHSSVLQVMKKYAVVNGVPFCTDPNSTKGKTVDSGVAVKWLRTIKSGRPFAVSQ